MTKKLFISILLLFFIFSLNLAKEERTTGWTTPKRITKRSGRSWYPEIALYKENIHIVWEDDVTWPNREIFYIKSTDNGETWSEIKKISFNGDSSKPAIAAHRNKIHAVWEQNGNIFYTRSINNGEKWKKPVKLSFSPFAYEPDIAVSKNTVHVVWMHMSPYEGVYYRKSPNNGKAWKIIKILSTEDAESPVLAAYKKTVHIVWKKKGDQYNYYDHDKLLYRRSISNGEEWKKAISFTQYPSWRDVNLSPDIAVYKGNVHVVWRYEQYGNNYIYYKRGQNNGKTWSSVKRLSRILQEYHQFNSPAISVGNHKVCVVWHEFSEKYKFYGYEIIYIDSWDNGNSWSPEYGNNISKTKAPYGKSENPSIAVYGNYVHVIWQDYYFIDYELWYTRYE